MIEVSLSRSSPAICPGDYVELSDGSPVLYESVSDAMEALPTDVLTLRDVVLRTLDPKNGKTRMHWTTLRKVTAVRNGCTLTVEDLQERA